jgi:sulfite reductase alpha subunit-like flavoprotein
MQPLLILYGSQTGNAQDCAETIAREARRRQYLPRVAPADAYAAAHLSRLPTEPAVIFVVSTTGQGEPPDNIRSFWRFLRRKNLPSNALAGVCTAVFGLGDSAYVKYNYMAKLMYRRLEALGAGMLLPGPVLADDQHPGGADAELDAWLPRLWAALRLQFPLPIINGAGAGADGKYEEPGHEDRSSELEPKYKVDYLSDEGAASLVRRGCTSHEIVVVGGDQTALNAAKTGHDDDDDDDVVPYAECIAAASALDALDAVACGMPSADFGFGGDGDGVETSPPPEQEPARILQSFTPARPLYARLVSNQRVTAETHFQDVRLLELDLSSPLPASAPSTVTEQQPRSVTYQPGDVIGVWPRQNKDHVQEILDRCGLDANAWVRVSTSPSYGNISTLEASQAVSSSDNDTSNTTSQQHPTYSVVVRVGALIAGALDVGSAPPRRTFFQALAQTSPAGRDADRLRYFASPQGRDDLHEYCARERRSALDVLRDFPLATPSMEWLLSFCPRLRPRRFSAASSQALKPDRAELLVAVVEWATPSRRRRKGLCSSWLSSLPAGATVALWSEKGALRMPASQSVPMVLVGPGTGVAPFRAFLQERLAATRAPAPRPPPESGGSDQTDLGADAARSESGVRPENKRIAPSVLFFGCRNERGDYYCRSEWEGEMMPAGVLGGACGGGLVTAFSRDEQPEKEKDEREKKNKKMYVTHRIREHGGDLWDLVANGGASVYVAGSADKMPADVAAAFRDVLMERGGMTGVEAEKMMRGMEACGRYQVEAWS